MRAAKVWPDLSPGGGTPLFGLCGYTLLNRVWQRSWVLNRVYNLTIKCLEQGVFLDWKHFKECEDLRWAVYICNTNDFFFRNIHFHDFSLKNYLNRYAKQNKSGSESSVSCLKQSSEMSDFCLKQGLKPGGTPHMKGVGMLVGNFELNPFRRPIWVWPNHPRFFWPLKETMPKFTPLSETTSIPIPFLCGFPLGFEGHGGTAVPRLPLSAPPISAKFWRATITFFSRKEKKGIYLPAGKNMNDWYI